MNLPDVEATGQDFFNAINSIQFNLFRGKKVNLAAINTIIIC